MYRIYSLCLDAAIAAVILIPLYLYLNRCTIHDRKRMVGYILFSVYLSAMFAAVGLPDIRYVRFDPHFNFTPFLYMFSDWANTALNVALFVPLGFFLPLFWETFRPAWRTVFHGFCISLFIEVLQIFTFRATDVNDLMTNTLGTLLGWGIARVFLHCFHFYIPGTRKKEVYLIYAASFGVMFFLQPFLAEILWVL